jgi:hypothetical protein
VPTGRPFTPSTRALSDGLINQQRIVVDHFTRRGDSWIESSAASLSSRISLRSLKVELSVRDIYRGVA